MDDRLKSKSFHFGANLLIKWTIELHQSNIKQPLLLLRWGETNLVSVDPNEI